MKNIKKYQTELFAAILGGFTGFLYWLYIGCSTGTCPITSHWYTSVIYGVFMGFLIGQMITDYKKKKSKKISDSITKQ
jgi:hypothetical protein